MKMFFSQSQPITVPVWVLYLLSIFLFLGATFSYIATFVFWSRSLSNNHVAIIATAIIGSLFLLPGVAAMRIARGKSQNRLLPARRSDIILLRVVLWQT